LGGRSPSGPGIGVKGLPNNEQNPKLYGGC
jgi:hypothetical protein